MSRRDRCGPGSIIVQNQTVPDDLADMIRNTPRDDGLNELLAAARDRGWTLTTLGRVLGMTYEGARQRANAANRAEVAALFYRVPLAPRRPLPMPKLRRDVPPAIAEELNRQWRVAATVNGATPLDDPRRQLSVGLAKWLADLHADGYSYKALARAVGCVPNAVKFRIGRHGHGSLPPSLQDKPYRGIRNGGPGSAAWRREVAA